MNRTVVDGSSSITSIGYDNGVLEVEFKSGKVYRFREVPPNVHRDFLDAPSKGKFFHSQIKGQFTFEKEDV